MPRPIPICIFIKIIFINAVYNKIISVMCNVCKVYIGDKKIVDVTKKEMPKDNLRQRKNTKVFVLEDGTFVRYTSVNEFKYICEECGGEFISKSRPDSVYNFDKEDEKPYICKRCR